MNVNSARALTAAGMLLASAAVGMIDTNGDSPARVMPRYCGFYAIDPPRGELTGYYNHCGDSFILIKLHWDTGSSHTSCVPPWYQEPFYRDGPHKVVNAYYVTTPPNLTGPPDDLRCSLSQPRV